MYKGFIFFRTDNSEIEDSLENIFNDIPILIKISKDSNLKDLLEGSIKAVLLDKDCKDYGRLFNEFRKKDIGIISIGKEGDISFPFNADELLSKIDSKELYIPEIRRFDLSKKLSRIDLIKKISSYRKSNKKIYGKNLEDTETKKAGYKKLINTNKVNFKKILKKFRLNKKLTEIIYYSNKRKLEGLKKKNKEYRPKKILEKKDKKKRNLNNLTESLLNERDYKKIDVKSEEIDPASKSIYIMILNM